MPRDFFYIIAILAIRSHSLMNDAKRRRLHMLRSAPEISHTALARILDGRGDGEAQRKQLLKDLQQEVYQETHDPASILLMAWCLGGTQIHLHFCGPYATSFPSFLHS